MPLVSASHYFTFETRGSGDGWQISLVCLLIFANEHGGWSELIFGATGATGGRVNFFVSCVNF